MPFSCFLFRPRKRLEKRRKRSHTNVSNTLVTRPSTPPAQTAHVRFHGQKWVHARLCSKNRTQRLTGRSKAFRLGVVSLPSARFACCRNAGRPLVKTTHLPFSWSGYFFVDFSGINYAPIRNLENLKTILIFSISCGMVVLLEIKPLHRSYYVGKLQKALEADDRQKSQQN